MRRQRADYSPASSLAVGIDVPDGQATHNLPSCLEAPELVDEYVTKEQQAGRLAGPFPDGYHGIRNISPIGFIPTRVPGSYRIIHHLSFPAGLSVNDFILRSCTSVSHGSVDQAVRIIASFPSPFGINRCRQRVPHDPHMSS